MIVGGYELHLYCDHPDHAEGRHPPEPITPASWREWQALTPGQYAGQDRGECMRQARQDGWTIKSAANVAICPLHVRVKRPPRE